MQKFRLSAHEEVDAFYLAMLEAGFRVGEKIPRGIFDTCIERTIGVTSDPSIRQRIKLGENVHLWKVVRKHGKGGAGHVVLQAAPKVLELYGHPGTAHADHGQVPA